MAEQPFYTCPTCGRTSHHPMDVKHKYCGACYKFENPGFLETGTARPEDTYCVKCDVFGHAEGSPACEFYFKRWESTDGDDDRQAP